MSVPKKHHFVPQFVLRNFADHHGKLVVYRTDKEQQYEANVRDIGHRNFGHSLFRPNREPDHVSLESRMSDIEGAAAAVIEDLRGTRAGAPSTPQREVLSFLIALQWARSRFLLTVLRREVLGRDTPTDESNRSLGLFNIVASVLEPWSARQRGEVDPKERYCSVESMLAAWGWRVYRPRRQQLIIADNVISMWGVAAGKASSMPDPWTRHGVGVGFGNCARITMPLAPGLGLVLTPAGQTPRPIRVAEFNRATIYNSREFVAHHPDWQPGESLRQAFDDDMWTQRWILPMILEGSISGP